MTGRPPSGGRMEFDMKVLKMIFKMRRFSVSHFCWRCCQRLWYILIRCIWRIRITARLPLLFCLMIIVGDFNLLGVFGMLGAFSAEGSRKYQGAFAYYGAALFFQQYGDYE